MLTYADSSFVVRLVTRETGSEAVVAAYRRMARPRIAFGPLHDLEVRNALRLKAWTERQSGNQERTRRSIADQGMWELRLEGFMTRGSFSRCAGDWQQALSRAAALSSMHTPVLGTRAFDILHVALALEL